MSNQANSSGGLGLAGVLLVVFLVLKLTGLVSWLWLWVLSPVWIPFGVAIVILFVALIIHLVFK